MHLIWNLLKESWREFGEDHATRKAAALAYYTLFSLAPLLIISIAVAGAVFGQDQAREQIISQLQGLLGDDAAKAIEGMLRNAARPGTGLWAAAAGVVTLILGATTAFAELKQDLDEIWDAPKATIGGLWYTVRTRLLSFGVILSLGFLLLVSLVFSAAVEGLQRLWHFGDTAGLLLQVVNFTVSFALISCLFAMLYKLLPSPHIAWRDVIIGAIATAALFSVGKQLIGLYLGHSAVTSTYGAAGAAIVILVWVYYSALIFLFGAEFTHAFAKRHGSHSPGAREIPVQEGRSPGVPAAWRS